MHEKYPTPSPGQKNANHRHGTKGDKHVASGHRGTMGHKTSGYGGKGKGGYKHK